MSNSFVGAADGDRRSAQRSASLRYASRCLTPRYPNWRMYHDCILDVGSTRSRPSWAVTPAPSRSSPSRCLRHLPRTVYVFTLRLNLSDGCFPSRPCGPVVAMFTCTSRNFAIGGRLPWFDESAAGRSRPTLTRPTGALQKSFQNGVACGQGT